MLSGSIRQISRRLQSGEVTASELVENCLARAHQTKDLNAFVTITADLAREQAQQSDERRRQGQPLGPLDGVPVSVKDNFCVRGAPTTCGSRMLAEFRPPYTASVVRRLLRAGACLIGKTNLDEFGMGVGTVDSFFGPTKNVWGSNVKYKLRYKYGEPATDPPVPPRDSDEDFYIPGGSSGGSAVSVASGSSFVALGSDTGGSVRNPAASCGLVGLKPSYGLLSRHGLVPLVHSMDAPGLLARTVADAALVFDLLSAPDALDSTCRCSARGLVVGVPREYHCPGVDSQVLDAWEAAAAELAAGGATVRQVSLPHTQHSIACYSVLNAAEVASNMARYDGVEFGFRSTEHASTEAMYADGRRRALNEVVRGRVLAGNYFLLRRHYDDYMVQAMRVRRLIQRDFELAWRAGCHLLLTPVTLTDGHLHSEFVQRDSRTNTAALDYCTQPANMAGVPAVSLPVRLSSRGLPISLQLMAPPLGERRLLAAARWLERRLAFPRLELV
ncbi:glutamyl-tRNA(Gln) amidotransferase subunit A, mitochondrial-like [Pollicipes pollicipes]|uniref:glutamyl-tRNA(Gln) amidotransferase subunit A, mitochondrial-like n=1 Tax=Pollicipes pollicipes TaxID=41117 RepID=UPI001885285B|nr:glutamyl-tRNA(Gln) amidotransferase subunit A, mitochondrial-like [Pollicipes pollicipes]